MLPVNETLAVGKALEGQPSFDGNDEIAIMTNMRKLYAYGRVDYEALGISYFNQFCYEWNPVMGLTTGSLGFRKGGPVEYNRQT